MKIKSLLIITIIISILSNLSILKATTFEIWIANRTGNTNFFIKFYPVGALVNGRVYSTTSDYSLRKTTDGYSVETTRRNSINEPIWHIVGLDGFALDGRRGGVSGYFELFFGASLNDCKLASDASNTGLQVVDGIFGHGIYNLEIYDTSNPPELII